MLVGRFGNRKSSSLHSQSHKSFQFKRNLSVESAKVVRYDSFGAPENVLKVVDEKLPSSLKDNEILVKFLAAPINPADLNMVQGTYGIRPTLPKVAGNEGVGVVVEVGSNVKNLTKNARVIPARPGLGTWRTHGVFSSTDFQVVPSDVDPLYASTISVNPSTAQRLLNDFVDLKAGDVIVQNGSTSSVALSVMQLAAMKGIKTINVLRDRPNYPETVERLKTFGGTVLVSEEYFVTPAFKRVLTDMPKPKLALNCVGGNSATELARVLGEGGVHVTYGGMSHKPVTVPTSALIFNNIQMRGFWLTKWYEKHSEQERIEMHNELFGLIKQNKFKLWMETYPFAKFSDALKKHSEPYRDRKVVLVLNDLK